MLPRPALPLLLALAAPAADARDPLDGVQVAQLTIHERIVIRVPRMPVVPPAPQVTWREKGGTDCVKAADLAGALITGDNQVDLVLRGGRRIRAKLEGACRPLDFYSGFYLRPAADGKICADRDAIRARSGATCPIDQFKWLKAQVARR